MKYELQDVCYPNCGNYCRAYELQGINFCPERHNKFIGTLAEKRYCEVAQVL